MSHPNLQPLTPITLFCLGNAIISGPNLHHTGCLLTAPPPLFRIKQANLSTISFRQICGRESTSLLPNMFLFFADIVEGLLQNTSY